MPEKLLNGLYRLKIPIPKNPLKFTNVYVLEGNDEWLIIDVGLGGEISKEIFMKETSELAVNMEKTTFFLTHMHADHCGLIGDVARESSEILLSKEDLPYIFPVEDIETFWNREKEFSRIYGFPSSLLDDAVKRHPGYLFPPHKPKGSKITYVNDGDVISMCGRELKVIKTPGHTKGHICLYDTNNFILFCGDHVLGNITPNISSMSTYVNPLFDYLNSLEKVYNLEVKMAFAGHRDPIKDFRGRIDEIKKHHRLRTMETLDVLKNRKLNAYQIASKMSWDINFPNWDLFPSIQKWFAHLETVAHLEELLHRGKVRKEIVEENDGEVFVYEIA